MVRLPVIHLSKQISQNDSGGGADVLDRRQLVKLEHNMACSGESSARTECTNPEEFSCHSQVL
jgi:hypothetical protein